MKTLFLHSCIPAFIAFIAFLLMMVCITNVHSQVININQTFSSDTIFAPFSGSTLVYSLKAYGNINHYSDSSLVRVVMVDSYGNHWLVYESYPLITDTNSFVFTAGCDETCFMDGIVLDSIRIDIISAFLTLDSLKLDTNYIPNAAEIQAQAKLNNDSVKIAIINQRIVEEHMYWRAGRTSISVLSFTQKETLFGLKYNIEGYEYYKGGLFERLSRLSSQPCPAYTSTIVESFDWRSRHSANVAGSPYYDGKDDETGWITTVNDQDPCNYCWAFSPVAAVEARANIYYNSHDVINHNSHLDLNLSEEQVARCHYNINPYQAPGHHPCTGTGSTGFQDFDALDYMVNNYVDDSLCFPYDTGNNNPACTSSLHCTNPSYQVKIDGYTLADCNNDIDQLKNFLINQGPLASGIETPYHFMLLVGFETVYEGLKVYQGSGPLDPDIIIEPGSRLEGSIVWRFKNSYGKYFGNNGFTNTSICIDDIRQNETFMLTGEVRRKITGQIEPITYHCTDEDDDGYYWWGLNPDPAACGCPPTVLSQDEEDCDDSNKDFGPYNKNYSPDHPLYECKENCPPGIFNPNSLIISCANCTLSYANPVNRNIEIKPGGGVSNPVVTLNSVIRMHPRARILVYPGATLQILQGGRITSSCNQLWKGIRVFGTGDLQSATNQQGKLIIFGSSTPAVIESAIVAVKDTCESPGIYSGAIINAVGATFKDNGTAVKLMAYPNPITETKFLNCIFEAGDTLSNGEPPIQFVRLDDLTSSNCLKFEHCTFSGTGSQRIVTGIRAHNAGFICQKNANGLQTQFTSLLYGVNVTNTLAPGSPFTIKECNFSDNARSVFMSGVNNAHILSNSFNIPLIPEPGIPLYGYSSYGIYSDACFGYHIENNNFFSNAFNLEWPYIYIRTCGAYIKGPSTTTNEIYRNNLTGLHCGIASYGENRSGNSDGLSIKCNNFTDNKNDIGVYRGTLNSSPNIGINFDQGVHNTSSTSLSAGNVFTSSNFPDHLWDIDNTYANPIRYNHHDHFSTNLKVQPDEERTSENVDIYENGQSDYTINSCPSNISENLFNHADSLISRMVQAKSKIDSISALLEERTDGGNTDSVNQAINFSTPPIALEIYNDLLSKSPYLSDTVMKSAIIKEEVLPNAMIRDILVANPHSAKSDSVMDAVDARFIPMPDSMYAEIMEGENITGEMEELEAELAYWHTVYGSIFNELLSIYISDTLHPCMNDSINNLFSYDFRLPSKYSLALRFLRTGDVSVAETILNVIPLEYPLNQRQQMEYQYFQTYFNCVKRAIINNEIITYDSVQVETLQSLISDDSLFQFLPTILARNELYAAGHLNYIETLLYDNTVKSAQIENRFHPPISTPAGFLRVFPNPAHDYIIIEYKLDPLTKYAWVTLSGIEGKVLERDILRKPKGQHVVPIKAITSGSYLVSLFKEGKHIHSVKVVILR